MEYMRDVRVIFFDFYIKFRFEDDCFIHLLSVNFNKTCLCLCLQRTIEKRIFDDCELGIQSDEELIKSIETKMPLHGGCNDTIIEQQISNMDWIMELVFIII